jgi:hypothetical protein
VQINEQQQIEVQEKSLARFLEWIRHADSKSQIFISLNLAMIAAIVAGLPTPDKFNVRSLILLVLGAGIPVVDLIHCLHAVAPKTTSNATKSHIFFGLVQEPSAEEFHKNVNSRRIQDYLEDLNDQCFANSQIASKKYRHLKSASIWTFRCMPIWITAIYLIYRWR